MAGDLIFRLIGVEKRDVGRSSDPDFMVVTYGVKRRGEHAPEWLLPVTVSLDRIGDDDLIKVARSHLADMLAAMAEETAGWKLSTEWFEANVKQERT